MKEPLNLVVSNGAGGLKVQKMGLSAGEARLFFDGLCARPPADVTEIFLYEKLKARKSRRLTQRTNGVPVVPAHPPVMASKSRLPKIIRRGR